LPIIFKTDYNNIPPVTQELLNIEKDKTSFWKNEIKSNNFKIGIAWRGNVENKLMFDKNKPVEKDCGCMNMKSADASPSSPSSPSPVVSQTNTYILVGALIVSIAIISMKK
jgi:hypothetical protein